ERHRQSGFVSRQLHLEYRLSCFLIECSKFLTAALWSGREESWAVAGEKQSLRYEQRGAFGISRAAEIDAGQRRMVANVVGCLSVRHHPEVFTGVEIDGGNSPPWWLDQRQPHRRLYTRAAPDIFHIGALPAFSKRAGPPVCHRRHEENAALRICGSTFPIRSALVVRNSQRALFASSACDNRRRVQRAHLELRCNADRFSVQLRSEIDEVILGHALPIK